MLGELGRTQKGSAKSKRNRASLAGRMSFWKNESGNFGMIGCMVALPLVACVGMATDYGRSSIILKYTSAPSDWNKIRPFVSEEPAPSFTSLWFT